jgi:hypothetical protein
MKKTFTVMKSIAVALTALVIVAAQAQAAVTVYADEVPSSGVTAVSVPVVETNGTTAQADAGKKDASGGGNPQVRIDETGVHIGGPNPVDINAPSFLRHNSVGTTLSAIFAIVGPFITGVAIVAIVFYFKHRRNRMMHETLRAMIDKGMPITPELIANLRGGSRGSSDGQRFCRKQSGRLLPGLIMIGIGAAFLIADPKHSRGGGIALLFMGLAFLVVWVVERKTQGNQPPPR